MPTVYSLPWFFQQFCDSNGDPLSGGKVRTKNAGTSDDKATYSDTDGTVANANPVILDSSGMCVMFLQSGSYDFYVYDSADNLIKTIEGINSQTATTQVDTMADLKALPAGTAPIVRTLGYTAINDGGGWWYYWAAASTATNDDGMVIQPDSLPSAGRWLGIMPHDKILNLRVYGATCDGIANDYTKLNLCNTYCAANDCTILIDSNTYIDNTVLTFTAPILLLPSVVLSWDDLGPTFSLKTLPDDYTQHFSCVAAYVPTLDVNGMYYEWFGETIGAHSVTDAAIVKIGGKPKILTNDLVIDGTIKSSIVQQTATIGSKTVDANANELVLENNGSCGATIYTAASESGAIYFGNPNHDSEGRVMYTAGAGSAEGEMSLWTAATARIVIDKDGNVRFPHTHTPSSASDTGVTGTISWDADYIYICIATNTWKRVAIATW